MTNPIPLREGLFRETKDGPTLLAGQCTSCEQITYPSPPRCPNCGGNDHQCIELGRQGQLHCATVVHMGSQHFKPGYVVGYVNLPHGIRIFSQIGAPEGELPLPGTPMQLEILPLWEEDGREILAYRFVPTAQKENTHA